MEREVGEGDERGYIPILFNDKLQMEFNSSNDPMAMNNKISLESFVTLIDDKIEER